MIAVAALLVGLVLGSASSGAAEPKDSSAYKSQSAKLQSAQSDLAAKDEDLAKAQEDLKGIAGELPAREAALKEDQAALKAAQGKVSDAQAELEKTQSSLSKREKAVGLAETTVKNNTIPGDGTFEVGKDMKAGTYKSAGADGGQCYSAVNADANGSNIKSNNITSGPSTVQVSNGEFFETSGCKDWVLQP